MVTLTDSAANEVRRLVIQQREPGVVLRIGVQGGGCSGLSYTLNLDTDVGDLDEVSEQKGVKVVVDEHSSTYLDGVTVDFVSSLMGSGFKFLNPNAARSCGCGSSFGV